MRLLTEDVMKVSSRRGVASGEGTAKALSALRVLLLPALLVLAIDCSSDGESEEARPDAVADEGAVDVSGDAAAVDVDAGQDDPTGDDAADGSDIDDERAPPAPGLTRLSNGEWGGEGVLLAPDDGEEGFLAAARLTPPGYPFVVEQLSYSLGHGPSGAVTCNATYEHRVRVFAATGIAPPAVPDVLVDVTIPEAEESALFEEGRYISVELEAPVTLNQGEHLYVAIPLVGSYPDVMCILVDMEAESDGSRDYWSNSAEPPYDWVQLDSFGLEGSIVVMAYGRQSE